MSDIFIFPYKIVVN